MPVGKFDASGIDDTPPLVGAGSPVYGVVYGDRLSAIKGAMLTISRAVKAI